MKNALRSRVYLTVGVLCFGLTSPLTAATIFDNSKNDLVTRFNPGTTEVGDEILLGSTERYLTNFSFEYWGVNADHPATFAGTIQARVEFYVNNGLPFNGYATPGTKFFDSGWFLVPAPTDRNTFVFTAGADFPTGGLFMPVTSNMTWSVKFEGMQLGDSVGVDLYSPPVVGHDYPDYWQNNGGTWSLMTNSGPVDFAAVMQASGTAVPEPSTLALSILGGLGLLMVARRVRRRD